jgi:glutamate--cysteine ligase
MAMARGTPATLALEKSGIAFRLHEYDYDPHAEKVGLLYDDLALDEAWELVKHWTDADRQALRTEVPRTALAAPFPGNSLRFGTVGDLAREVVAIASAGLARRNIRNATGHDESAYLAPLEETLRLGKSPAQRWLDLYNGEWQGDLTKIFEAAEI